MASITAAGRERLKESVEVLLCESFRDLLLQAGLRACDELRNRGDGDRREGCGEIDAGGCCRDEPFLLEKRGF